VHLNENVKQIYKQLGPFDYFQEKQLDDDDEMEEKTMQERFDTRRSGNMYRGEIGS